MEFTDQNFEQEVENEKKLVLVDFFAPWCGPCKMMSPIIEELAQEYKNQNIKIGKVNVDNNQEIAEKYNIMGVPTMIFFKEGKNVEQIVGFRGKDDLKAAIDKHIV
jgi:thioredoxin 1